MCRGAARAIPRRADLHIALRSGAMPAAYRWDIRTSWMQQLPGWRRHFQKYFLLYPSAFESFDLGGYDLILSSSAYAKGVIPSAAPAHLLLPYPDALRLAHRRLYQARGLRPASARRVALAADLC